MHGYAMTLSSPGALACAQADAATQLSEQLIGEVEAEDIVVIGTPTNNFTVPSVHRKKRCHGRHRAPDVTAPNRNHQGRGDASCPRTHAMRSTLRRSPSPEADQRVPRPPIPDSQARPCCG